MQAIYNIAAICALQGIEDIIVSPGSRVAPLTVAFVKHPDLNVKTIPDERSAAYIALGIALHKKKPVVISCTSGTAMANYAPAITEAYYQKIPLIVITADRPIEWIDQGDGQSIRQYDFYKNHIKKSYQLPTYQGHPDARWHIERVVNEAINISQEGPSGPVHINVPLREPFYPKNSQEVTFDDVKINKDIHTDPFISNKDYYLLNQRIKAYEKVLIVVGQGTYEASLVDELNLENLPVVSDCIANIHRGDNTINHHDIILSKANEDVFEDLQPELLITFGDAILSKNLKTFLRDYAPEEHWHIQSSGPVADVFKKLTLTIRTIPEYFFRNLIYEPQDSTYLADWLYEENKSSIYLQRAMKTIEFGEFKAMSHLLNALPDHSILHLGNSMPVRYANYLPFEFKQRITVYANRGTSGIDGSLSTALGTALSVPGRLVTIILGDMSFFYDRNALWNNYIPPNLRIVVLNNKGGGIFRMIPGPLNLDELEEYFVTKQKREASFMAAEANLFYEACEEEQDLKEVLEDFYEPSEKAKLLEVFSESKDNSAIFGDFKRLKNYGL